MAPPPTSIKRFPIFSTTCASTLMAYSGGGGGGRTGVGNYIHVEKLEAAARAAGVLEAVTTQISTGEAICNVLAMSGDEKLLACGIGREVYVLLLSPGGEKKGTDLVERVLSVSVSVGDESSSMDVGNFAACKFKADSLDHDGKGESNAPTGCNSLSFAATTSGSGSGSGKYTFASGGEDSIVRVWSLTVDSEKAKAKAKSVACSLLSTFKGHGKAICCVAFPLTNSNNSNNVCSSSKDGTARVWSYKTSEGLQSSLLKCSAGSGGSGGGKVSLHSVYESTRIREYENTSHY